MNSTRFALLLVGTCLPLLAGCGSGSSPPFSASCVTHRLPGGAIRANVKVTNGTSNAVTAYLYGPVFTFLRHFYPPTLLPSQVQVVGAHSTTSYIAFAVPNVSPKQPAQVILRFVPPPHAEDIAVTNTRMVQDSDGTALQNKDCVIKR